MTDSCFFTLALKPNDFNIKRINELNELLSQNGISFNLSEDKEANNDTYYSLIINYDTDIIQHKINRNAGANKKYIGQISTATIRERMKTESAEAIAADLGISRATLFRRLKNAEEWNIDII